MAKVYIDNQDNFEKQLNTFNNQCRQEGIVRDFLNKSRFTSTSEIDRYKKTKQEKAHRRKQKRIDSGLD